MVRETAAARAAREWAETRAIATAAGYVNPYPEPGTAPVLTIDDRCPGERCQWSLYVSLRGDIFCPNPKCEQYRAHWEEVHFVESVSAAE